MQGIVITYPNPEIFTDGIIRLVVFLGAGYQLAEFMPQYTRNLRNVKHFYLICYADSKPVLAKRMRILLCFRQYRAVEEQVGPSERESLIPDYAIFYPVEYIHRFWIVHKLIPAHKGTKKFVTADYADFADFSLSA